LVITRKNQVLLRFLKIRVIVNGTVIYPIENNKPVIVPLASEQSKIVVTDGFHFTKPLQVAYRHIHIYYVKVACAIDDDQLVIGFIILGLLYAAGLTSDLLILKVMSFIPLLYFLFVYYINRKSFIQITPA
jgi:hypothetical protein